MFVKTVIFQKNSVENIMENEEKLTWQNCIVKAIEFLDVNGWENDSTKYDLVYNEKRYPTKPIISKAFEYIKIQKPEIHEPYLGGGKPIKLFLEKLGFKVLEKNIMVHDIDFFTDEEFMALNKSNGLLFNKSDTELKKYYSVLKTAYEKLHYLTEIVQKRTFVNGNFNLLKKPTNQANRFQGYLWSKIYPTKYDKDQKWISYTLGLGSDYHYNIKIDTVGLQDGDKQRIKYLNYCGDYYNSEIVFRPKNSDFNNWNDLIDYCIAKIDVLKPHYQNIKQNTNTNVMIANSEKQYPLNQILYGPPGTGKTFNSINRAIEIINPNFDLNQERSLIKKEYDRLVAENQIMFTTFHQSMSYEDFIEGIKPETKEENVIYDVVPGLFLEICNAAENNWEDAKEGNSEKLSFEEALLLLKEEWVENEEIKFPLKREGNDFTIIGFTKKSIQFKKASGGTGHTLSIGTLKDYYYKKKEVRLTGVGIYYPSILDKLNKYQPTTISQKVVKNYVIIIDEINRGNVSQIFGELITLIEEDKRLGEDEALEVMLPYSKEKFGVPPNLYIVGTMNTADRSVEALDTALRRRFTFEEMPPRTKVVEEKEFSDYPRASIMEKINNRIEVLLDRNHTLGHAYFIKKNFKSSFENEIIPLLQEYFYNDYGKIGLVLGKGFVREKAITAKNDKSIFADFDTKNDVDINKSYELIPFTEVNFDTAIQTLLV